jgi:hypothetical protein
MYQQPQMPQPPQYQQPQQAPQQRDYSDYVGSGKEKGQDWIQISFSAEDLQKLQANLNERGYVNLNMNRRQQPSQYGHTHSLKIYHWQPTQQAPAQQPQYQPQQPQQPHQIPQQMPQQAQYNGQVNGQVPGVQGMPQAPQLPNMPPPQQGQFPH